jgi:hypothetical protein
MDTRVVGGDNVVQRRFCVFVGLRNVGKRMRLFPHGHRNECRLRNKEGLAGMADSMLRGKIATMGRQGRWRMRCCKNGFGLRADVNK